LGFDCGHAFDLAPKFADEMDKLSARHPGLVGVDWRAGRTYRTFGYVQEAVASLARQCAVAKRSGRGA
jgi:hypothetical protein